MFVLKIIISKKKYLKIFILFLSHVFFFLSKHSPFSILFPHLPVLTHFTNQQKWLKAKEIKRTNLKPILKMYVKMKRWN